MFEIRIPHVPQAFLFRTSQFGNLKLELTCHLRYLSIVYKQLQPKIYLPFSSFLFAVSEEKLASEESTWFAIGIAALAALGLSLLVNGVLYLE
jgi:hypothetical protein